MCKTVWLIQDIATLKWRHCKQLSVETNCNYLHMKTVNLKSQTCRKIGKHVGNQGAQHEHHELFHRRSHLAVGLPANSRIHPNFPVLHAMNYPKTHPNCHSKLVRFLVMTDLYTKIHHLATTCQFHHNHFCILLRSFCPFCQNLCLCLCLYFSYLSACPFL